MGITKKTKTTSRLRDQEENDLIYRCEEMQKEFLSVENGNDYKEDKENELPKKHKGKII